MRAATTDVVIERRRDIGPRRRRVAVEQRLRRDQYARKTVTALAGLQLDEGPLQWVRVGRCAQSLDGRYAFADDGGQRLAAGFLGQTIDQHHARPALFEPATEPRA